MNPKDTAVELFRSMYDELKVITEKKGSITLSKFQKYIPLFQKLEGPVPANGSEEFVRYQLLSEEYSRTVNIFEPVNILDDSTGEVIAVLPPVYKSSKLLSPEEINKNANFHIEAGHDFPGASDRAFMKYTGSFVISQELDKDNVQKLRGIIANMNTEALKKLNGEDTTQTTILNQPANTDEIVDLEFEVE